LLKYTPCILVDWSGGWAPPWGLAKEERRLRASRPVITPSDQHPAATLALSFRAKNICCPKRLIGRPQEALLCAKAKRQQQMFYLCESEAAATNVYLCESEAAATKRPVGTEINHT